MAPSKSKKGKKMSVPRNLSDMSNQQITLHRRSVNVLAKSAADAGNSYLLTLADFNDADIVSLFSEYKILSVRVTHQLVNAPNNNATFPRVHIAPRGYSATPPSSRNEVLQYNGLEQYQFGPNNISFSKSYKPFVWVDTVTTGASAGKEIVVSPWLGTDTDTVRHNFAVTWVDRYNSTTDPTHTLELLLDVTLCVRKPR